MALTYLFHFGPVSAVMDSIFRYSTVRYTQNDSRKSRQARHSIDCIPDTDLPFLDGGQIPHFVPCIGDVIPLSDTWIITIASPSV